MSAGDSKVFLPSSAARSALRFQQQGVFQLIPLNIPELSRWTSHKDRCAHDGVSVDFARFGRAAAGLVFNDCSGWSGWSGWSGARSADVGDLLACERSGDGLS